LGGIDALNLRSAMTLFHRAAPDEAVFSRSWSGSSAARRTPATDRLLAGR